MKITVYSLNRGEAVENYCKKIIDRERSRVIEIVWDVIGCFFGMTIAIAAFTISTGFWLCAVTLACLLTIMCIWVILGDELSDISTVTECWRYNLAIEECQITLLRRAARLRRADCCYCTCMAVLLSKQERELTTISYEDTGKLGSCDLKVENSARGEMERFCNVNVTYSSYAEPILVLSDNGEVCVYI